MDVANPRRFILGAMVLVVLASVFRHVKDGEAPPLRIVFGALVAGVLLSVLSEVEPKLASAFAAFFALSVLLTNGGALDAAINLTNRKG
jgi:hypothetical protein